MDTSETYIKMNEKAEEIQNMRLVTQQAEEGDYFTSPPYECVGVFCSGCNTEHALTGVWNSIWLPRQDQLQEMISHGKPISLVKDLSYFCFPLERLGVMPHRRSVDEAQKDEKYIASFITMEQLWLAFCMSEKFNKIWDGASWIVKK